MLTEYMNDWRGECTEQSTERRSQQGIGWGYSFSRGHHWSNAKAGDGWYHETSGIYGYNIDGAHKSNICIYSKVDQISDASSILGVVRIKHSYWLGQGYILWDNQVQTINNAIV